MVPRWVLGWGEAAGAGPGACGGKGWNLGRLRRYGFPVPAGGVLVADAYDRLMTAPPLAARRDELAGVTAAEAASPEVVRRLESLRAAVLGAELPSGVADAVRGFLGTAGLSGEPLAVRSSAAAEDGAAASFAGIHQSFLNVRGADAVLAAVKGCYASLWTPHAVAYRRRLGIADREAACAVVLCAMVRGRGADRPRAAGVAFSCDPHRGRRDVTAISAVHGLGDALVSGRVTPEEITVVLDKGELRVAGRRPHRGRVLSDDEALQLARLTTRVHWALGDGQGPQDVEWAHDGERFWLVQARPVTRVPRVAFPEIAGLPVVWSNANLKEAIPGVVSTLTASTLFVALDGLLYAAPAAVGYAVPPGLELARRFAGRAYFDLSLFHWIFYDSFGLLPAEANRALGGYQPELPVPAGSPYLGRRGPARLLSCLRLVGLMFVAGRRLPRDLAAARRHARRLLPPDLDRRSPGELLGLLYAAGEPAVPLGVRAMLAGAGFGVWQLALETLLARVAPGRSRALAAGLMAGSGLVTTAEQGYRLHEIAEAARREPAARDYLGRSPLAPHGWRDLPASSRFRGLLERFLADFGHRAVYETEIANPRWREDPSFLLHQVRSLLSSDGVRLPRDAARAVRAAAEAEVARHTFWLRPLARWLAGRVRHGAAMRDAGRSAMMALWEPVRTVALAVGRRLAGAGALDDPADVVHLAYVDIEMFCRGEWDGAGARELVEDRKARADAWRAEEPPDVLVLDADGRPAELPASFARAEAGPADGAGGLVGVGVSAGRASGPARVLRHPSEGEALRAGDVLVAASTDPAWTPLFLRAAAVVTEVGGYLSHAAIVAREYGIPAVSNVHGVLGVARDGQRLTVDGDAGVVVPEAGP